MRNRNEYVSLLLVCFTFLGCNNSGTIKEKNPILLADREAPVGWVYLRIYEDSTFEFSETKYQGKVIIKNDTLRFQYKDSVPKVKMTAIIRNNEVIYTDGFRERLAITLNKLKK